MRRIITSCLLLLTSLLLAMGVVSPAAMANEQPSANQQRQLKTLLKRHHINGIILVNGTHDRPRVITNEVHRHGITPVKANQLFPIASLQKVITGLAIMNLVSHHQLSLTSSLAEFEPSIPLGNQITIKQLMTHHSGIRDGECLPTSKAKTEQARIAAALTNLQSTGDFTWHYSDADFILLTDVIRQTSHKSYYQYVQKHVLPVQLRDQLKPISKASSSQVSRTTLAWSDLTVQMASVPGAGDCLMSPRAYWRLIMQRLIKRPRIMNRFAQHQQVNGQETYFGGVYINHPIIHANGNFGEYSCSMYADYQKHQMIMIFANNLPYSSLRSLNQEMFKEYFGYQYIKGTNQP